MRVDELETALRDAAMSEPAESRDVYPTVVRIARRRRTLRRAVGAGALVCVITVALVGIIAAVRSDSPSSSVSIAQSPSKDFHPPSHTEGDRLVIPVTFLSGGHGEIVMPSASINRGELTFLPGGAITWSGSPELGRTLDIRRGTVANVFAGQQPAAVYRDASGLPVPFYTERSDNLNYLAFQFGNWVVRVWDYPQHDPRGPAMTQEQRRFWAAHLGGHVTQQGFLVLDPVAPLAASVTDTPDAEIIDGPNRMGIIFGGCSHFELQGNRNEHGYIMSRGAQGPVLCNPDLPFTIWMGGDQTFEQAANSLEIRNLNGRLPGVAR
jgi:hypothetical protein